MPVVSYVGLPGSGKSHSVVQHVVLPALRKGRVVVTNIPMQTDLVRQDIPGADLRVFDTEVFAEYVSKLQHAKGVADREALEAKLRVELDEAVPPGCVWVVDECWRIWPTGQKEKDVAEPFRAILAEHRHRVNALGEAMQVVLVTQDLAQIGTFARRLVDETFRTTKLGRLGLSKSYRVDVFQGSVQGQRPPDRLRTRQIFGKYSEKVWRYYKSHTKSEAADGGADEAKVDGRGVLWKSPVMYLGLPLVIVLGVVGTWGVVRFLHGSSFDKSKAKASAVHGAAPVARGGGHASSAESYVSAWRIVATMEGLPRSQVYLSDGSRWVRLAIADFCDRDLSGFLSCLFEGQRVSGQVHYYPPVASGVSAASVMPAFLAPASPSQSPPPTR